MEIREDFKSLIPPLGPDEFLQLEQNCVRDGIRDPLITWGDVLIDGHNRYEIAKKHNLEYKTISMDFPDETAAKMWVIQNQLGRRNLPPYDRSVLALKLKSEIQARAKERQGSRTDKGNIQQKSAESRDELATIAGVSHDTIHKVEKIEAEAPERVKQAVRQGKMSINQAYNSVHPKAEDPVKRAEREHEQFKIAKQDKVINIADIQKDKCNKDIIKTAMYMDLLKLFDKVSEFYIKYDGELDALKEIVRDDERNMIISNCDKCERIISEVVSKIK